MKALRRGMAAAFCMLVLVVSCSTLPAPFPARDIRSISGKWAGWANHQQFGRCYLILRVHPDSSWKINSDIAINQRVEFFGKVWVDQDGKFQFVSGLTPEMDATGILYVGSSSRTMMFKTRDGYISAELMPSYK